MKDGQRAKRMDISLYLIHLSSHGCHCQNRIREENMSDTITRRDAFYVLENCRFASEQEKRYAYSLMEQVASADVADINVGDMISRQSAIDALSHMTDTDGFRDG